MKNIYGTIALVLLASCGNPHLELPSKAKEKTTFSVAADPLRDLIVTNTDGSNRLSALTDLPSTDGLLSVNNPNSEDVIVAYAFEKGDHFRFNGGSMPGTNGSCAVSQLSKANCILDVEFHATTPGVYNDNLIITFALASKPEDKKTVLFPLKGEKTADALPIELLPNGSAPSAFPQLVVSTELPSIDAQIIQRNGNPEEVIVTYAFEVGANFRFNGGQFPGTNGTCKAEELPTSSCELDIEFFSSAPGLYIDNLIATYALKSSPDKKKIVKLPLRGERIVKVISSLAVTTIGGGQSIDFGTDNMNVAPRTDRILVQNNGTTDQTITVRLIGGLPFSMTNKCPATLTAGTQCEISVTYTSAVVGIHRDVVEVTHRSLPNGNSSIVNVPVIGETVAAPLQPGKLVMGGLDANNINFGTINLGNVSSKVVEVKNIGELPVTMKSQILNGSSYTFNGGAYPGTRGTCADIILPGSCTLDIKFSPADVGTQNGNMILLPTAGSAVNVFLSGAGKANVTNTCVKTEETVIAARTSANPTGVVFPYLPSKSSTTSTLTTLYGTATNGRIEALNRYIVKDAQVYVSFDMPVISGEIVDVSLDLDVTKVIQDDHKDTESLCISANGLNKCSGREFTLDRWQKLRNPKFWTPNEVPVTSIYEDELRKGEAGCGNYRCFTMVQALSTKRIFDLTAAELKDLSNKKVNFIFSDDTRLRRMPTLRIKTNKTVACQ